MRDWKCKCGHEVVGMGDDQPPPIHWDDGHVCHFVPDRKSPDKHIRHLKDPDEWFHLFFQPLKRDDLNGNRQLGVVFRHDPCEVKFVNMHFIPEDQNEILALPGTKYASVEEMVLDGWEVD